MAPDAVVSRRPVLEAAWQEALADQKVQQLAGLLDIDLADESRRQAVLAHAAQHLERVAGRPLVIPAPDGQPAFADLDTAPTPFRIEQALRAYREIAAL